MHVVVVEVGNHHIPGPGTKCALVMCDQSAILYIPPPYCITTVLPMSANLRSSKIKKSVCVCVCGFG